MKLKGRRRIGAQGTGVSGFEFDALAGDLHSGLPKQVKCTIIIAKLHTDGLKQPVGMVLDPGQRGTIQQIVDWYVSRLDDRTRAVFMLRPATGSPFPAPAPRSGFR